MPSLPAHRANVSHHTSFVQGPPKKKSTKEVGRKQSGPLIVDRKQAVYAVNDHPTPSRRGSVNKKPDRKTSLYEPTMARSDIKTHIQPKDPDGRLYEVVQTRMIPSKLEQVSMPSSLNQTEQSFLSCAHPYKMSNVETGRSSLGSEPLVSSKSPYSSDRSTQQAIERIKRNIERKEQFLMSSNEPYFPPKGALVYRQYQVSPQRIMPRPIWPPVSTQSAEALDTEPIYETPVLRRVKSQVDTDNQSLSHLSHTQSYDTRPSSLPSSPVCKDSTLSHFFPPDSAYAHIKPSVGNAVAKPYGSHLPDDGYPKSSKPFVSTLSRIQENIPTSIRDTRCLDETCASTTSLPTSTVTQSETPFGSSTSLTGSKTVPLAWVGDNERIKQLQIVSTRAKKFESLKDREATHKSALQRFELSRLSQRSKAVAHRKEEFEKRQSSDDSSALHGSELDLAQPTAEIASGGNRTNPVGGPKIHCVPPLDHMGRPLIGKDAPPERDRSHSTCSHTFLWRDSKKAQSLTRQHSFHSTLRSQFARAVGTLRSSTGSINDTQSEPKTRKRDKQLLGEHDRLVRRVSYLRATSDKNISDSEHESEEEPIPKSTRGPADLPSPASFKSSIVLHGQLNIKLAKLQGKKAGDRSWKCVWGVIRGKALIFYKDKQIALLTPLAPDDQVTLRGAQVAIASDYTKKRNVLRLSTPVGSQFLLQAESEAAMTAWLTSLTSGTAQNVEDTKQTSAPDLTLSPMTPDALVSPDQGLHSDGEMINKNIKKIVSPRRTRSPSNQWPIPKSRKSTGDAEASPKSKTWKGRIGKHLRKMQASTSLTSSNSLPHGASIGVCIDDCPPSVENEMVPLIVALCVGVIESKGSHVQGIYRIPGNRAAVTYLTEMVNQGPHAIDLFDPRWSDINVISSLLKQFFSKLPDPLITSELYENFIDASKLCDPMQRLIELKTWVHELPDCHYETLHYVVNHFTTIVANSDQNKMDVKNLAIVFGPTLVRAADDNVARLVTDMSHQCRIVESLITHGSWFFSDTDAPPIIPYHLGQGDQTTLSQMETSSQSLLLNNVTKVEGSYKETNKFVSSLISAANRIHKNRGSKKCEDLSHSSVSHDSFEAFGSPDHPLPKTLATPTNGLDKLSTSSRDAQYFPSDMILPPMPKDDPLTTLGCPNIASLSKSEPCYLGDEVAIRSYTGLSARTQERIRQFEMETRAMMLQRDILSRQESQKIDANRKRVEDQLQKAKHDLETEDIFDRMAKNPSEIVPRMSDYLVDSGSNREGGSFPHLRSNASSDFKAPNAFANSLTQSIADSPTNSSRKVSNPDSIACPPASYNTMASNYSTSSSGYGSLTRPSGKDTTLDANIMSNFSYFDADPTYPAPEPTSVPLTPSHSSPQLYPLAHTHAKPKSKKHCKAHSKNVISRSKSARETILRHILPFHSHPPPRPLRRGSSAESLAAAFAHNTAGASVNAQPCDNLGLSEPPTRLDDHYGLSGHGDQQHSQPNEGSDLLRDITATFEEKMRSLQESPFLTPEDPPVSPLCPIQYNTSPRDTSNQDKENNLMANSCKLYRDPSLHRRRSSHASKNLLESPCNIINNQAYPGQDPMLQLSDPRLDNKEKSEKRARELHRGQDNCRDKRPKQTNRSKTQEIKLTVRDLEKIDSLMNSCDVRSRKHNVKELKEKFELCGTPNMFAPPAEKTPRATKRKSRIKRRHTVGGMKDLARVAWLRVIETANQQKNPVHIPSWDQIQLFIENVNESRKLIDQPLIAREKLSGETQPDFDALLALMLQPPGRRPSLRDSAHQALHPLLESNV